MSISSTVFGVNDTSLPPKADLSEQEKLAIEGRLLRVAFGVVALGIIALYAADSFAPPDVSATQQVRSTPTPLL